MLETVKQRIQQLIAAYEKEKFERERLNAALIEIQAQNEAYRKQITELDRQIDNLKLAGAFKADGSPEARKKIDRLMKEIDKCIALLEG
jgi:chromosome segregation ATPase